MGRPRGGWRHPGTVSITGGLELDPEKHTESDPAQAAPLARGSSKDGLEVGRWGGGTACPGRLYTPLPQNPGSVLWLCVLSRRRWFCIGLGLQGVDSYLLFRGTSGKRGRGKGRQNVVCPELPKGEGFLLPGDVGSRIGSWGRLLSVAGE